MIFIYGHPVELYISESKDIGDRVKFDSEVQRRVALRYAAAPTLMRRLQVLERQRWDITRFRAKDELERVVLRLYDTPTPAVFRATKRSVDRWMEVWSVEAYRHGLAAAGVPDIPITRTDLKWIRTSFLKEERRFMAKFLNKVRFNKISRLRARQRAGWYAQTLDSIFWTAMASSYPERGTRIRWKLSPAEHCPDCLRLAARSRRRPFTLKTLPTTPRAGFTRCLMNCKCRLEIVFIPKRARLGEPTAKDRAMLQLLQAGSQTLLATDDSWLSEHGIERESFVGALLIDRVSQSA